MRTYDYQISAKFPCRLRDSEERLAKNNTEIAFDGVKLYESVRQFLKQFGRFVLFCLYDQLRLIVINNVNQVKHGLKLTRQQLRAATP